MADVQHNTLVDTAISVDTAFDGAASHDGHVKAVSGATLGRLIVVAIDGYYHPMAIIPRLHDGDPNGSLASRVAGDLAFDQATDSLYFSVFPGENSWVKIGGGEGGGGGPSITKTSTAPTITPAADGDLWIQTIYPPSGTATTILWLAMGTFDVNDWFPVGGQAISASGASGTPNVTGYYLGQHCLWTNTTLSTKQFFAWDGTAWQSTTAEF